MAWLTLFDIGHAPLFGAIALAILGMLLSSPLAAQQGRLRIYALALGLTLLVGVVSELLQLDTGRNRDPWDVARDALGAGAFLLFAATLDPRALRKSGASLRIRALSRAASALLLALACVPGVPVVYAYAQRAAALPRLCEFEGGWSSRFVGTNEAELALTWLPGAEHHPAAAGRITFLPAHYSSFKLLEPYPDWSGYESLHVAIYSELGREVELTLRIHDRWHENRYSDRFNRRLFIRPGNNEIEIPLLQVRTAPEGREMDMAAIRRLTLFAIEPTEPFSLYLVELRLI